MQEEKMNERIQVRLDKKTSELLEKLKQELKITKSDIIRMSVNMFSNYVEKVNR